MAHNHTNNMIIDADPHFRVNIETREVQSVSKDGLALVQGDHNSERITFVVPRYIDCHDLLGCNKAQVHYINVSSKNKSLSSSGVYEVVDMQVSPDDDMEVMFTWLVSHGATTHVGTLSFVLSFACTEGTEILYSWNTTTCSAVRILETMSNVGQLPEEYSDVLLKWYNEIISAQDRGVNAIDAAVESALSDIETKKDEILAESEQDAIDRIVAAGNSTVTTTEQELAKKKEDTITQAVASITAKQTEAVNAVGAKQTEAISAVDAKKTEAVDAVGTAQSTATTAIDSAKTAAVTAVGTAQTEAANALDAKKSEVLSDIENADITAERAKYLRGAVFSINISASYVDNIAIFVNYRRDGKLRSEMITPRLQTETYQYNTVAEFDLASVVTLEIKVVPSVLDAINKVPFKLESLYGFVFPDPTETVLKDRELIYDATGWTKNVYDDDGQLIETVKIATYKYALEVIPLLSSGATITLSFG